MKLTNLTILFSIFCLWLTSCVSREIIDGPEPTEASNDEIVLHLSAPESAKTRSDHNGYKLRYVVKLFSNNVGSGLKFEQRKDIIEGETTKNEITFVAKPGPYKVMVFADYIPEETKKNGEIYEDCFYDTSSEVYDNITLKGTDEEHTKIDEKFFNNDNLDCFSDVKEVTKKEGEQAKVETYNIPRAVSKVRFIDDTPDKSLDNVKINIYQIAYCSEFAMQTGTAAPSSDRKLTKQETFVSLEIIPRQEDDKELFCFYTFGPSSQENIDNKIKFDVILDENKSPFEYGESYIPIRKNYITTIKGKFIPSKEDSGEPIPEPDTDDPNDDLIHVWVSTEQNFGSKELSPID